MFDLLMENYVIWLMLICFGSIFLVYVGDGNFYVIILFDFKNKEEVDEVLKFFNDMVYVFFFMEGLCYFFNLSLLRIDNVKELFSKFVICLFW